MFFKARMFTGFWNTFIVFIFFFCGGETFLGFLLFLFCCLIQAANSFTLSVFHFLVFQGESVSWGVLLGGPLGFHRGFILS